MQVKFIVYIFVGMIALNKFALDLIKEERSLFIKIQLELKISERTMYNYINSCSEELTKLSSINALVEFTNMPLSNLIEGGKLSKLLAK